MAEPLGSFEHLGNGSYRLQLASARAGSAQVQVSVDGVLLEQAPVVQFVSP